MMSQIFKVNVFDILLPDHYYFALFVGWSVYFHMLNTPKSTCLDTLDSLVKGYP